MSDGASRIFSNSELTLDALLASACIPSVHHSVEIDGVAYRDGGLTANPPVSLLLHECRARDVLVVVLNPGAAGTVPSTADTIGERLTQISFSSPLATELNVIALAKAEAERARWPLGRLDRRLRHLNLHVVDSGAYLAEFAPASRFNTDAAFIGALRDEGRRRADAWLGANLTPGSRSIFEWKVAPV